MGTDRENIGPQNLCIMKANVRYQQKVIFSIKKWLPIQSMISSGLTPVLKLFKTTE